MPPRDSEIVPVTFPVKLVDGRRVEASAAPPWSPSEAAWKKMERFSDARSLVRVIVPIAELPVAAPDSLPRAANITKIISALAAGSKDLPPTLLGRDALGGLVVHDGRHRIAAAREAGLAEVPALIEAEHVGNLRRLDGARRMASAEKMPRIGRPVSCGFASNMAEQMLESLLGNPHTVFYDPNPNQPGDYRYMRVRSQNADWWQEAGVDGLNQKKLRVALNRAASCEPLNLRRQEDRWLAEEIEKARRRGWYATFHGHPSPIGIDPEPPVKRRHFKPDDKPRRIYLALPEFDYHRVLARASALHESPNLFLGHVIHDRLETDEWAEQHKDDEDAAPF